MKRISRLFFSLFCIMGLVCSAHAQTSTLMGKVFDRANGSIVDSTYIILEMATGGQLTIQTDGNGEYFFTMIPYGSYLVKVTKHGYHPLIIEGVEIHRDTFKFPNIKISKLSRKGAIYIGTGNSNKTYYESGKLRSEGAYKPKTYKSQSGEKLANEVPHGLWRFYSESGAMIEEKTFKTGILHGSYRKFSEKGEPLVQGTYKFGIRSGQWFYYNEKGQVEYSVNFKTDGVERLRFVEWMR